MQYGADSIWYDNLENNHGSELISGPSSPGLHEPVTGRLLSTRYGGPVMVEKHFPT
jgi:hypothetical protein